MKILFVCGAGTVSGREIATLNLIEGLRARGHEVKCVASTWGDGKFQQRLEALSVPFVSLPLGFISKTLSWTAAWMTIDQLRRVPGLWRGYRRLLKEFAPDAVVQSNFHHVFLLWPLLNPSRTFFHVHDGFPETNFYRRLFRFLSGKVCTFITVSRYIAETVTRLGVPAEKVRTVYNGVAVGDRHATAIKPERRNGSRGVIRLGIVGQVGEWKGHDDLIEALRELRQAGLAFSCTIFGEGEESYISSLTEKIDAYNLSAQVRQAGFVRDPSEIYRAIDVCVVPSRVTEAFGMVAAEAAHFGLPVVATRQGALSEIVRDGETGCLVDKESPAELASKLRLLIEDAALREKMGEAARLRAFNEFTREHMAEEVEAVFRQAHAR